MIIANLVMILILVGSLFFSVLTDYYMALGEGSGEASSQQIEEFNRVTMSIDLAMELVGTTEKLENDRQKNKLVNRVRVLLKDELPGLKDVQLVNVVNIASGRKRRDDQFVNIIRLDWRLIFDVTKVYQDVEDEFDVDKFVADPDPIVQSKLQNDEFVARLDSRISFGGVAIHRKDNAPQIRAKSEDPFMIERNFNAHCTRECNSREFLAPVDLYGNVDISAISLDKIQTIGDLRNLECFSICKLVGCLHDCSEVLKSTNHCLVNKYNQGYFTSLVDDYDNCKQAVTSSTTKAPLPLETIQNISSTTDAKADFLTTASVVHSTQISTQSMGLTTLPTTSRRSWTSGSQSTDASSTIDSKPLYNYTGAPNTTEILHNSPAVQQSTTSSTDVSTVSPPSTTYSTETTKISSNQSTTNDILTTGNLIATTTNSNKFTTIGSTSSKNKVIKVTSTTDSISTTDSTTILNTTTDNTTADVLTTDNLVVTTNESTTIGSTSPKNKLIKVTATTDSGSTTDATTTLNTTTDNYKTTTLEVTTDMQAIDNLVVSKNTTTINESTSGSVHTTTPDIISSTSILSTAQSVQSSTSSRSGRSVNTTTSQNQTTPPVTTQSINTTIYSTTVDTVSTTPSQTNTTTQMDNVTPTSSQSTTDTSAESTTQPITSQPAGEFSRVTMNIDLTMDIVGSTSFLTDKREKNKLINRVNGVFKNALPGLKDVELINVTKVPSGRKRRSESTSITKLQWLLMFDVKNMYNKVKNEFDPDDFVANPDSIIQNTVSKSEFVAALDSEMALVGVTVYKKQDQPQIMVKSVDPFMIDRNFNAHCSKECNAKQFLAPLDSSGNIDVSDINLNSIKTISDLRALECTTICKLVDCSDSCSNSLSQKHHCSLDKYNKQYFQSIVNQFNSCKGVTTPSTTLTTATSNTTTSQTSKISTTSMVITPTTVGQTTSKSTETTTALNSTETTSQISTTAHSSTQASSTSTTSLAFETKRIIAEIHVPNPTLVSDSTLDKLKEDLLVKPEVMSLISPTIQDKSLTIEFETQVETDNTKLSSIMKQVRSTLGNSVPSCNSPRLRNKEKKKNANLGIFNLVNKLYENDSTGCCEGGCSSDIIGYEWDELSMFKTVPCLLSDCGV